MLAAVCDRLLFPTDVSAARQQQSALSAPLLDHAAGRSAPRGGGAPRGTTPRTRTTPPRPRASSLSDTSEDEYSPAFDDGIPASPSARDRGGHGGDHPPPASGSSLRRILEVSWPCLIDRLTSTLVGLVSILLVGRQSSSSAELAAIGLGNILVNMTALSVVQGLSGAMDTLASQGFGVASGRWSAST